MDVATFRALLEPPGQQALAVAAELAPTEETFLPCFTKLEKMYEPALAKAALETVILRQHGARKFAKADSMYFTRAGLEMASGEIVSRHRARRYAPFDHRLDLCCGIGGDAIALSFPVQAPGAAPEPGGLLTAVDLDPLHLAMARVNVAAYGNAAHFLEADLSQHQPPPAEAAFFDPGRRGHGRRRFSVQQYDPPLSVIGKWLGQLPALGVKISPGVDLSEIAGYDCEIEFISVDGDLKECALWFGPLKTAGRRASLLSKSAPAQTLIGHSLGQDRLPASLSAPRAYLYEPDPAILRAGLVAHLAADLGAAQLDPDIAYLTADTLTPTPFARPYAIEAHMPFNQKRLREKLRAMNVGRVTIKKRGSPLQPEAFARALKLKGEAERIVFLTHVDGKPWALIGAPASPTA